MKPVNEVFKKLVKKVLMEELKRVPEMTGNGIKDSKDESKTFKSDENSRDIKCKKELLEELSELVVKINKEYSVRWDDHDDIMIDAKDLMSIKVTPNWEDSYELEIYNRNEDRLWITGQSWEQVKEFVKNNLKDAGKKSPTYVEKAYDKSYRNRQDQSEKKDNKSDSSKNKIKEKKVGESKNKEKDYNSPQNKTEDDPTKPMKEVGKTEKQIDHKVKEPVKLRKKNDNSKHVVKMS